jgi:oligopeptidase A
MTDNPLLSNAFEIPFPDIGPEHVGPGLRAALAEAEAGLARLRASTAEPTYVNTVQVLDDIVEGVVRPYVLARHLIGVATTPELRQAFNEVLPEVSGFLARLGTDPELWQAVARYADTPEAGQLDGVRRRNLQKVLAEFKQSGASLPETERRRAEALRVELAQLTTKFAENVLDATNAFELVVADEREIAGLPEGPRRRARADAESRGLSGYRFTLQAPSYLSFIKYVDDRELRKRMYEAYNSVGTAEPHDNRGVMREILAKRRELAVLLGYADYADLQTEDRMIKSGLRAAQFEEELVARTRPYFEAEMAELERFAATELGISHLEPWDLAYASEKLRLARFDVDDEALRPYFPLPRVLAGLFDLTEKLFGVKVSPVAGVPTWHPEVDVYHLHHEDGTFLGSFYADWFPRESKRDGAWMNGLKTGGPTENGFEPHVGIVATNFTPAEDDRPALLTHAEVETVFHEFGHLLHHVMCRVEVRARASAGVPWDFVELPSQIMENWTWEKAAVDLFAGHFETGAPLHAELFDRLARSRNFMGAVAQMRQLEYGTVDLALHRDYDPAGVEEAPDFGEKVMRGFHMRPDFARGGRLARFTHIFAGGYAAGYYSYKWSEVLDADAFSRFAAEGIFNGETGRRFAATVLERGDADDADQLFRDFMGRDPDLDALIRRSLGAGAVGG